MKRSGLFAVLLGLWFGLALLAAPGRAAAASGCTAAVTSGSFGNVDVLAGGSTTTTATLSFSCTGMVPGVPVSLCPNLDAGSGGTDGSGGRYLANGTSTLAFQIYQDNGYSQSWGSATLLVFGAVPTITITPDASGKASTTATLYAKVTASSTAPPGTYTSSFANQGFWYGLNLLTCAGVTVGATVTPATFTFAANVQSNCNVSATDMGFGSVGLLTSSVLANNQFTVTCTNGTAWSVGLDNGKYGSGPAARQMAQGGARVTYGIYTDTGRTAAWGATGGPSGTGTGLTQTFKGYGKVPAQTTPASGPYSDQIVATITY